LICETLDGNNLNASVDMGELVENRHLGADVIDHERILAELHFDTELFSPKGFRKLAGGNAPGEAPAKIRPGRGGG
jgi:hypothetical protein